MKTQADKAEENKGQSNANEIFRTQPAARSVFQFLDNRPEAVAQRKLQEKAGNSPRMQLQGQTLTGRLSGPVVQRVRVGFDVVSQSEIRIALLDARIRALKVVLAIMQRIKHSADKLTKRRVGRAFLKYFGAGVTMNDVLLAYIKIDQQIETYLQTGQIEVYNGEGAGDPFSGTESIATNAGQGVGARIRLRYPQFWEAPEPKRSAILIHEASHGLSDGDTRDIAYMHDRLFPFLIGMNKTLENADTFAGFSQEALGDRPAEHPPLDVPTRNLAYAAVKNASKVMGLIALAGTQAAKEAAKVLAYANASIERREDQRDDHPGGALHLHDWITKYQVPRDFGSAAGFADAIMQLGKILEHYAGRKALAYNQGPDGEGLKWPSERLVLIGDSVDPDPMVSAVQPMIDAFQRAEVGFLVKFIPWFMEQASEQITPTIDDSSSSSEGDSSSSGE